MGLWIVLTRHGRRAVSGLLRNRIGARLPRIDGRHAAGSRWSDLEDYQFLKLAVLAVSIGRGTPSPQDGGMRLRVLEPPFELFAEDAARAAP